MKIHEEVRALQGTYYVISPYHKNKKKLPFTITGSVYSMDYPVEVNTVEYKGWEPRYFTTGYKIESIREMIEKRIINKYPNQY